MANKKLKTFDIFVGNLPHYASNKSVGQLFCKYGEIKFIHVGVPKAHPQYKYGFVGFLCEQDAVKACAEVNNLEYEGSRLVVERQEFRSKGYIKESDGIHGRRQVPPDIVPEIETGSNEGPGRHAMMAMATHVEPLGSIWVQVINESSTNQLMCITEQLAVVCPAAAKVTPDQLQKSKMYAAQYTEDSLFYRCKVVSEKNPDKVIVQYIDYGNSEETALSNLVELPMTLSCIKPLAKKFILHNTYLLRGMQPLQYLRELVLNKTLEVVPTRTLKDGTGHYAYMYHDGVQINDLLVSRGLANRKQGNLREDSSSTSCTSDSSEGGRPRKLSPFKMVSWNNTGTGNRVGSSGQPSSSASTYTSPCGTAVGFNPGGWGGPNMMPQGSNNIPTTASGDQIGPPLGFPSCLPVNNISMMGGGEGGGFPKMNMGDSPWMVPPSYCAPPDNNVNNELVEELKKDVGRKNKEIEKLKGEIAKKDLQLQALSVRIQRSTVIERVRKVTKLRQQFPLDRESYIEEAIQIVSDKSFTMTKSKSLQPIQSSLAKYKAAQQEIMSCTDKNELESMTKGRNDARRDLHEKLERYLDISCLPVLSQRLEKLKDVEFCLRHKYKPFLQFNVHGCPPLEEIISAFKEWKTRKLEEFKQYQEQTNCCQKKLMDGFEKLSQLLTVDLDAECDESDVDLESLMKQYHGILQQEINTSDIEHNPEASMVATVLVAILREIDNESKLLENLQKFHTEFSALKDSIKPWLTKEPDFVGIEQLRKQMKALKSKLRHKEADRQDLLEDGGDCAAELQTVEREVNAIKTDLHHVYVKMDAAQADLAFQTNIHFPEYKNDGIDLYVEYQGLVKTGGRELQHYIFENDGAIEFGMRPAIFADNPAYVVEYPTFGNNMMVLKQINTYRNIAIKSNKGLLHINAVFLSKDGSTINVEMSRPKSLKALPQLLPLSTKDSKSIFKGVLQSLVHLHQADFVHAEVNPEHIAVDEDGCVWLMPPDLSKPPNVRAENVFISSNGLKFQPLEHSSYLRGSAPYSTSSDLYNLGLLLLWMHKPDQYFELEDNGTVNLRSQSLSDENAMRLVYNLIKNGPDMRLDATKILKCDYVCEAVANVVVNKEESQALTEEESEGGDNSEVVSTENESEIISGILEDVIDDTQEECDEDEMDNEEEEIDLEQKSLKDSLQSQLQI